MTDIVAENLATAAVPRTDWFVMDHHSGPRDAIDGMPAWRQLFAETNPRSCRQWLKLIDRTHENGRSFSGPALRRDVQATPEG
jgi:hypothetical protein